MVKHPFKLAGVIIIILSVIGVTLVRQDMDHKQRQIDQIAKSIHVDQPAIEQHDLTDVSAYSNGSDTEVKGTENGKSVQYKSKYDYNTTMATVNDGHLLLYRLNDHGYYQTNYPNQDDFNYEIEQRRQEAIAQNPKILKLENQQLVDGFEWIGLFIIIVIIMISLWASSNNEDF